MKFELSVLATLVGSAVSWGHDGHKTMAQLASSLLTAEENSRLNNIANGSLPDIANWADQVHHEAAYAWSSGLHFINNPDGACTFDYKAACPDDRCAAGAIVNFTHISMDAGASQQAKQDALRFVVHFVGDIHQPLHCGWTTDQGGNKIDVTEGFDGNLKTELHAVWDYGMIDRIEKDGGYDWTGYEAEVAANVSSVWKEEAAKWKQCFASMSGLHACVSEIAQESLTAACEKAYKDENGKLIKKYDVVTSAYYESRKVVVAQQLAAAGVRLAVLLRGILGETKILV